MTSTLPRVAVIGTGGTISSWAQSSLDSIDYPDFGRKLPVAEILDRFEETRLVADPLPISYRSVGSTAIGPADWIELREILHATSAREKDLAGFAILHGTATLEETAFFLNLTLAIPQTVVLVGAQRPVSALGTDAGINLVNALRVAGSSVTRNLGVLVVLNDEIHAARDVVKTSTYRQQTFRSLDFGALGHVDGDGIHIYRKPAREHAPNGAFASMTNLDLPRVDIIMSYAGADGVLIDAAVAAGARGLVSAGLAPGLTTPGERKALERAASSGIVVVQCSRAASGRVGRRRYLSEAGMIAGEDFSPQKARILLSLALARGCGLDEIADIFARC
jgi:L-asparaginase